MGTRLEMTKQRNGDWHERTVPLGMQIIDTRDLHEVHRAALPLSGIRLTPDGNVLLGQMLPPGDAAGGGANADSHRLTILETRRLEERGSFDLAGAYPYAWLSGDGRYAYLTGQVQVGGHRHLSFRVVEVSTLRVLAERAVGEYFGDLINLTPGAGED